MDIQVPFCEEKSVQLVRVAFYRSDFLQNPYFKGQLISKFPFGVFKSPKKTNDFFFKDFCPSI